MAAPRRRPLAEHQAAAQTRDALAFAVAEFERQKALEEEIAIRRAMGERERARTYRAPARVQGMTAPRVVQGNAQPGALHQQSAEVYRNVPARPALTPAQQEAYDAQIDYQRNWMARDEAGNLRLQRQPLSDLGMEPTPVGLQREIDRLEAPIEKPTKKPRPMKVRV